jgi:hypothetical protein
MYVSVSPIPPKVSPEDHNKVNGKNSQKGDGSSSRGRCEMESLSPEDGKEMDNYEMKKEGSKNVNCMSKNKSDDGNYINENNKKDEGSSNKEGEKKEEKNKGSGEGRIITIIRKLRLLRMKDLKRLKETNKYNYIKRYLHLVRNFYLLQYLQHFHIFQPFLNLLPNHLIVVYVFHHPVFLLHPIKFNNKSLIGMTNKNSVKNVNEDNKNCERVLSPEIGYDSDVSKEDKKVILNPIQHFLLHHHCLYLSLLLY